MKLSDITTFLGLALCLTISNAAPAQLARETERDVSVLNMILFGAAEANYPLTVPLDCTPVYTYNKLSISQIKYLTTVAAVTHIKCNFEGVVGTSVFAPASDPPSVANWRWAMGPPQGIKSVSCCFH